MKRQIILISLMTLIACNVYTGGVSSLYGRPADDSIQVWSSPGLYDLTRSLVNSYVVMNPGAKIKIQSSPAEDQLILSEGNIGLVTKDYFQSIEGESIWRMAIGRDVVLPVMNPDNPCRENICCKGVSPEKFLNLYTGICESTLKNLTETDQDFTINCYWMSDEPTRAHIAEFLNTDIQNIKAKEIQDIDEFLNLIQKDKYAIGFCRLADIVDLDNQKFEHGVVPVPIDLNANNEIDYFENIYSSATDLERGIWIGKYPRSLYSNIFAVAASQPLEKNEKAFIEWLITDGQQNINRSGYSELIQSEKRSKLSELYASERATLIDAKDQPVHAGNIYIIIGLVLLGLILIMFLVGGYLLPRKKNDDPVKTVISSDFGENSIKVPGGIFFDKTHTWAFMERDGYVRTGIDDFLQHITGKVTKVKTREPGDHITKGETFVTLVQDGKHLDIKSPVSGTIIEKNPKLKNNVYLINSSPYSDGWLYTIKTTNWIKEARAFMMGETYMKWLKTEFSRLRDFLSVTLKNQVPGPAEVVMQEGGEIKEGLLELFGPEVWEEFQTGFINNSRFENLQ